MKKPKIILLTFAVTSAFWLVVVPALIYLIGRWMEPVRTGSVEEIPTNNVSILVMGGLTKSFTLSFREYGDNPTNLVSTNNLVLTRPLHPGQEFRITIEDLKRANGLTLDRSKSVTLSNTR